MIQTLGKDDPAALRRLQGKFRPRESWLAEAQERARAAAAGPAEFVENLRICIEGVRVGARYAHAVAFQLANSPLVQAMAELSRRLHEAGAFGTVAEMQRRLAPRHGTVPSPRS